MDAYCTVSDILSFAPEMKTEVEAGTIAADARLDYVRQATIDVKNALQGQYNLTAVETQLTASNLNTIRNMTALRAAWIALSTYQLGKNGALRMGFLEKRYKMYKRLIAKGSVRCDDGTYLSAGNVVQNVHSPIPTPIQPIYQYGPRLGVPSFDPLTVELT